jgi:hypothetical protein
MVAATRWFRTGEEFSMSTALIAGTLVTLVTAAGMLVARFLGGHSWWQYALGGGVAVGLAGGWLGSVGSAMATAVNPRTAMVRGFGYGFVYGVVASLVLFGCITMLQRLAKRG